MVAALPFATEHVLYSFHGTLPGGEVWTVGLRTVEAAPAPGDMQVLSNYAAACFGNFILTSIANMNPPSVTFDGCLARHVSQPGLTVSQAQSNLAAPFVFAGTIGMPNQVALCVSLHSAVSGRSGQGRIFLPLLGASIEGANGKLTANQNAVIAAGAGELVSRLSGAHQELNGADDGPWPALPSGAPVPPALWAIGIQSRKAGKGAPPVNRVSVGDVLDTMRGRRNKLIEQYASKAIGPHVAA